jgi:hypothetical protein
MVPRFITILIFAVAASASPSIAADLAVCGSKTVCGDMATCAGVAYSAEAVHYLTQCGLSDLDRDGDGIPCETICGKTLATMQARMAAQPFVASCIAQIVPDAMEATFTCGGKRTCKQMTSCSEARFYLSSCGVRSLDRDGDGVPCEGLRR